MNISVYSVTGRLETVLVNSYLNAGSYKVEWNAGSSSSGIYYCLMKADGFTTVIRMVLVK